jgi:serine/threonine-protein kinase RsbW
MARNCDPLAAGRSLIRTPTMGVHQSGRRARLQRLPGRDDMATFEPRIHLISADVGRLKEARDFADHAAANFGLDEEARYQVKLAMSEAVTNAIQHGSASAHDEIRILALEEAGALVFEVIDTGRFRPRVVRRGDMPESGRGLEFMRHLMDEVDLRSTADGTRLRFAKRRCQAPARP